MEMWLKWITSGGLDFGSLFETSPWIYLGKNMRMKGKKGEDEMA